MPATHVASWCVSTRDAEPGVTFWVPTTTIPGQVPFLLSWCRLRTRTNGSIVLGNVVKSAERHQLESRIATRVLQSGARRIQFGRIAKNILQRSTRNLQEQQAPAAAGGDPWEGLLASMISSLASGCQVGCPKFGRRPCCAHESVTTPASALRIADYNICQA